MSQSLVATFLGGALLASVAMNVYLWQHSGLDHTDAVGPGLETPELQMDQLELNRVQMNALKRLGASQAEAATALRQEITAATRQLQAALDKDPLDPEQVKALAESLRVLRRQEVDQQVGTLLAVRELLTPYQTRLLYQVLYPDATAER